MSQNQQQRQHPQYSRQQQPEKDTSNDDDNASTSTASPTTGAITPNEFRNLHPKLVLSPSKAHEYLFTKMRDINTSSVDFINYSTRSMRLLAEDALAEFPTTNKTIQTPCCDRWDGIERNYCANTANLCVVSIVRSGDTLASIVREIEPSCKVGKILIQRDEHSVEKLPQLIYHKLPPDIGSCYILLCDPMLATGGSAITALDLLCSSTYNVNPSNIIFANVISCPEGLRIMASKYPDVTIVTIKVDDCLNENKYIVPGLGDFGDRYYNT